MLRVLLIFWGKLPMRSMVPAQLDSGLSAAAGQLLDLYYTAKDLSADLIGRLEGYETNDAELDEIEQRMDLIYKLKRKYGVLWKISSPLDSRQGKRLDLHPILTGGGQSICRLKSIGSMYLPGIRLRY